MRLGAKQRDWLSGNPARMIAAIGGITEANRERLGKWAEECVKILSRRTGVRVTRESIQDSVAFWSNPASYRRTRDYVPIVKETEAAAMLHCLFGFPFGGERVKCPECKGNPKYGVSPLLLDPPHNRDKPCKTCQGTGTIPAPLIRDVWRTDTVIGLAREIAGGWTANQEVRFMNRPALLSVNKPPDYSRCPILAEALALEAGCDDELVLEHLRGTAHCGECTVLKELTR